MNVCIYMPLNTMYAILFIYATAAHGIYAEMQQQTVDNYGRMHSYK